MTLSVSTQVNPVGTKLIVDTEANATAKNSVTGAAGAVYMAELDNGANSDNPAYLKIYNDPAPVTGTTEPDMILSVRASQRMDFVMPAGWIFENLSFVCVIESGKEGTTSPTNPVIVRLVTT